MPALLQLPIPKLLEPSTFYSIFCILSPVIYEILNARKINVSIVPVKIYNQKLGIQLKMGLVKEVIKEIGNKSREFYEFVLPPVDMYRNENSPQNSN